MFEKLIEIGAKILDRLDNAYSLPVTYYMPSNPCMNDHEDRNARYHGISNLVKCVSVDNTHRIFDGITGYADIKREFVKALDSVSPVSILLVGPPGCGKSEFLKQIAEAYPIESLFIDGTYGSKSGIFEKLKDTKPRYVLLDEIDKLRASDQECLLNLMESGRLTKTTKTEHYDIELKSWVFHR
jgi:hypothetical protein